MYASLCLNICTHGIKSTFRRFLFFFQTSVLQGTFNEVQQSQGVSESQLCLNCTQVIIISLTVAIPLVLCSHTKKRYFEIL